MGLAFFSVSLLDNNLISLVEVMKLFEDGDSTKGYEKLINSVGLLTEEIGEMNRQMKLTRSYVNSQFENEVLSAQKENSLLLSKLKGDLSIKSAYLFSNLSKDLVTITDKFFDKKFQSNS